MQNLILLHGAIGASDQLMSLAEQLSAQFKVHSFNFSGHGGKQFPSEPFSMNMFASEVVDFMKTEGIEQAHVFGYSMGGYVAMYMAKHHPGRFGKIITLATKFHWDEETAAKEVRMIDPEKLLLKVPAFAEALRTRHQPNDWKELLAKTGVLLSDLGRQNALSIEDYKEINNTCLILLGDRDRMITLEEALNVYNMLPNSQFGIIPGTPHPIEQVDSEVLAFMIKKFLN